MAITIHQRVHGWLWNWRTGPGWVRDGAEMAKLRSDGMRVLRVQLQDNGEVPREQVDEWKAAGLKVWGAIRPSHAPLGGDIWEPRAAASWARDEKRRLALDGMDFNFEDEVRRADLDSSGAWSESFASTFRTLGWCPQLPCGLDTYFGSAAGGLNLGAYVTRAFRMNVQTYWGNEGIYDDPVPRIVQWCNGAQPSIPKANVKPVIRVSPNNAGALPDRGLVFGDCVRAGTRGVVFYYLDGAGFDYLRDSVRMAISTGAAY